MSETLGKMEKPEAAKFKKGRKLFLVPLIFKPMEEDEALAGITKKYWEEAEAQLHSLASRLSDIKKVYHELLAGDKALERLEQISIGSHRLVKALTEKGAELTPIEDDDILGEFLDWGHCLSLKLKSPAVFGKVYEAYIESGKKHEEHIAKRIDETLAPDETGVVFIRESHGVQFPADIEVFYVAPPSLDSLHRAVRDLEDSLAAKRSHKHPDEPEHGSEQETPPEKEKS